MACEIRFEDDNLIDKVVEKNIYKLTGNSHSPTEILSQSLIFRVSFSEKTINRDQSIFPKIGKGLEENRPLSQKMRESIYKKILEEKL